MQGFISREFKEIEVEEHKPYKYVTVFTSQKDTGIVDESNGRNYFDVEYFNLQILNDMTLEELEKDVVANKSKYLELAKIQNQADVERIDGTVAFLTSQVMGGAL